MKKHFFAGSFTLVFTALAFVGIARAEEIDFTPTSVNPNTTGSANTGAYGSYGNVSVGYSAYTYNYSSGYGTIGGSGDAIYSDNYNRTDGTYDFSMTFTADPGYTVTLNSFNLATYDGLVESVDISVTGGDTAYSLTDSPSTSAFTTYSPGVSGTSLTLTITNLYDVGLNTITYTQTPDFATVPEPSSFVLMGLGIAGLGLYRVRRRAR